MKRRRHLLTAFLAGLPLLVIILFGAGRRGGGTSLLMVALWAGAVLVLETVTWRMLAAPVREIMRDLGVDTAHEAHGALQSLRSGADRCEAARAETKSLLEDLTSSLGDGLLVASSDLEIRLINRAARRFCGVETVALGTHILEILRNPDAVASVESAAAGNAPEAVVIENRRGLWEIHAFPVRGGGAVVLLTDVTSVVALASRVFAAYFLVQAVIAGWLAVRRREWAWVAFFVAIGIAMAVIAVFGIPA